MSLYIPGIMILSFSISEGFVFECKNGLKSVSFALGYNSPNGFDWLL